MNTPSGLIIIVHSGLRKITMEEVLGALPIEYLSIDRRVAEIGDIIPLGTERDHHWASFAGRLKREYYEKVEPLFQEFPSYQILYFGLSHIPLTMYLGHLVGDIRKVWIYQYRNAENTWKWEEDEAMFSSADFVPMNLPKEKIHGPQEAVIRLGSYVSIDPVDTRLIVSVAAKEVDINLQTAGPHILSSRKKAEQLANEFYRAVHAICDMIPDLKVLHVFAAVPCGVAFLCGQFISPNKDIPASIYHFKKEDSPKYRFALKLRSTSAPKLVLTTDLLETISGLRHKIIQQFEDLLRPKVAESISSETTWLPVLISKAGKRFFDYPGWTGFAAIEDTNLRDDQVMDHENPEGLDENYENGKWYFSNSLLYALLMRLEDESLVLRAVRLFLLHEALHYTTHKVTSKNSKRIGQFPKSVETLDYQADVYALIHEVVLFSDFSKDTFQMCREAFLVAIDLMLETMWAFDDQETLEEMQPRRINRYLIWQLQYVKISHESCKRLEDILEILCQKPDIEIKGLELSIDTEERLIASLVPHNVGRLGIGVIMNQQFRRFGFDEDILNLKTLLEGFVNRDSKSIRAVLKGLYDTIH
jgi:hypothetical protein